jgi:hypothetical protein
MPDGLTSRMPPWPWFFLGAKNCGLANVTAGARKFPNSGLAGIAIIDRGMSLAFDFHDRT